MRPIFLSVLLFFIHSDAFSRTIEDEIEKLQNEDSFAQSQKGIRTLIMSIEAARIEYAYRIKEQNRLEKLFDKKATSEIDLRDAVLATAVAFFEIEERNTALVLLETGNEIVRLKIGWGNGGEVDLKLLQAQYALRSRNRCTEAKNTSTLGKAYLDYSTFVVNATKPLLENMGISESEFLGKQAQKNQAELRYSESIAQIKQYCR